MRKTVFAVLLATAFAILAVGQTQIIYNSIPKILPVNVVSEGPEAYAHAELGDGFGLSATGVGTFGQVTVVLSSWACQTGNWYSGNCVTTPGATFSQPITVNLYSAAVAYSAVYGYSVPTPQALIGSITQSFDIPYRPTSTPALCGGDPQRWYDNKSKSCYHGLAVPISVNFSGLHVRLPANNQVVVTVAYNTTDYGPSPIGKTACNATSAGCAYDSLNIGTDGNGPSGLAGGVGNVLVGNGIFINYTLSATACPGNTITHALALDTSTDNSPCWTGYHPQIEILANTNAKAHSKGNGP